MKAYVLEGINDLHYRNISCDELTEGWVLVKVKAAGICSSDIPRIFTKGTYWFPTIPGHELSGIVEDAVDEEGKKLIGKRVGIFPLIPCKKCEQCKKHNYEMCVNYDYIGSRRNGGFAEYVIVPIWNLILLPNAVTYEQAAMLEPLAVALHSLKRGGIKKGDNVAIVGTGMIGFVAAQLARCNEASEVTVIGRSEIKRSLLGDMSDIKYIAQDCNPILGEYDLVIEAVGSNESIELSIKIAKAGGRVVLMGNPSGNISLSQDIYWRILRKQLNVLGTWNSHYENNDKSDWVDAIEAIISKKVDLDKFITHRFTQEKLLEGLNVMKNKNEIYCKVMTVWNT